MAFKDGNSRAPPLLCINLWWINPNDLIPEKMIAENV